MTRLACAAVALLLGASTAHAAETIHQFADQVRIEARKLRADARLVQIDVMSFSLARDASGWPDTSRVGPPAALLLFYYVSPATATQIQVVVRAEPSDAKRRFLQARGVGPIQAEELLNAVSPYTVPIPDSFIELSQALAKAEEGGFQRASTRCQSQYAGSMVSTLHEGQPGRRAAGRGCRIGPPTRSRSTPATSSTRRRTAGAPSAGSPTAPDSSVGAGE